MDTDEPLNLNVRVKSFSRSNHLSYVLLWILNGLNLSNVTLRYGMEESLNIIVVLVIGCNARRLYTQMDATRALSAESGAGSFLSLKTSLLLYRFTWL